MDRRSFLRTSALGGTAAAATTLAAPAYAQGNRTLTMVTSVPDGFAVFDEAAVLFADMVTSMSGGQLIIDKKPAGSLVGGFEVFDAVSSGQADMYHSADYYFLNQHPGFAYFTGVPFGCTGPETMAWYYHQGGMELHHQLGELFNMRSYLCGNTAMQPGGWFTREVTKPEDFQGLRFRMPGQGGQVLSQMGASVQNIPGGEIYQALASGAIEGTDWIGPYADERAGFQEVAPYYYTSGFHEPGTALTMATNLDVWNSLTPAQQRIIEVACEATHANNAAMSWAKNGGALARLVAGGTQVREFTDEIWDAFFEAAQVVRNSNMSDPIYAEIDASYFAGMNSTAAWWDIGDGEFIRQRNRVNAG